MKRLLLIILLATAGMNAQKTDGNDLAVKMVMGETVFLHANATAFLPGETLFYKLYCQTNYAGGLTSKVGYVELVNSDRKVVFTHKLFFENGSAHGDFFVGPSLATGRYKLLGYTNAILNNPSKIFQLDINIINPFQVAGNATVASNAATASSGVQRSAYNLMPGAPVTRRQAVSFNLRAITDRFPNSDLSVSVRKQDDLGIPFTLSATEYSQTRWLDQATGITVLPEWRGEIIAGSVTGGNGQKVSLALSIPGKSFAFKAVNTDANGNFVFNLDKTYTRDDVFIQPIGVARDQYTILTAPRPQPAYDRLQFNNYFPAPQQAEAIKERSIAAQIQNAYYTHKADTLATLINDLFYEPVQRKYVLNDYTRFPTFAQTIVEVIEGAYFEQKNGIYTLFVRDNNPGRAITAPTLVLVDGLMQQDNADLFAYKASGIDHISILPGVYLYGPTAFNGIISVVTKNQDFISTDKSLTKASVIRPLAKKKYFRQMHDGSEQDNKIPDFRYQLLWLPKVASDDVSFYTSDVAGTYDLVIEGFSGDGEPVSIRESFIVE